MGLDMYLTAKYNLFNVDGKIKTDYDGGTEVWICGVPDFDGSCSHCSVSMQVGYWRKENHIHKWFVDNIQDGVDNCGEYYVSRESLLGLKKSCEGILRCKTGKTKLAKKEMPTSEGCFFGGVSYDKYYFNGLKDTIKIIDKCLTMNENWDFYYSSSW